MRNCKHPLKYKTIDGRWFCPDGCGYLYTQAGSVNFFCKPDVKSMVGVVRMPVRTT